MYRPAVHQSRHSKRSLPCLCFSCILSAHTRTTLIDDTTHSAEHPPLCSFCGARPAHARILCTAGASHRARDPVSTFAAFPRPVHTHGALIAPLTALIAQSLLSLRLPCTHFAHCWCHSQRSLPCLCIPRVHHARTHSALFVPLAAIGTLSLLPLHALPCPYTCTPLEPLTAQHFVSALLVFCLPVRTRGALLALCPAMSILPLL